MNSRPKKVTSSFALLWKVRQTGNGHLWTCILFLLRIFEGTVCGYTATGIPGAVLASQNLIQSQKSPEEIEYQVKAAFMYNFMKFTEWPKEMMETGLENGESKERKEQDPPPKPPMVIGIVGDNPFGKAFDPLLEKKIKDRSLQVVSIPGMADYLKKFSDRSEAIQRYFKDHQKTRNTCHVLFFCNSEKSFLEEHLRDIRETAVLTIGDMENFLNQRGIICFVKEENKIRFEIHLTQAEKQHLKISSQLLKLARRVIQEKVPNGK